MNRREALTAVGWILGGTLIATDLFIQGCKPKNVLEKPDASTIGFLNEVGETIIPTTNTPGAKAAKVGEFMAVMIADCYSEENRKVFMRGINELDEACEKKAGKSFMDCNATERTAFITDLDVEMNTYQQNKKPEQPNHYFRIMKELTLLGYFTSEVGATQALRYLPVPGKFENIPYKKGDKAWAL